MEFKAQTKELDQWVVGCYLKEAVMTGENFNGFIDTYGDAVGPIIIEDTYVAYEIDIETLCVSTPVLDVDENQVFVSDILTDGSNELIVLIYSENVVAGRGDKLMRMPTLICSNEAKEIVQLVQRSDGSWITFNNVGSFTIKVVGNSLRKINVVKA